MGFLTNFFTNVFDEEQTEALPLVSSFDEVSEEQLEDHLSVSRYGSFQLTDAVRPSFNLEVVPSAGFRHDTYHDDESKADVPVLMASASRERLMETFVDLLAPLGPSVDVVLETSHGHSAGQHTDLYREQIDMPILQSILWDFEDLLTNDGCTGIAVLNPRLPQEVQLDEHKLLIVYGSDLRAYEGVLIDNYIDCREEIRFITEAEHVHSTTDNYIQQFAELKMRLGMDGTV
ncbi:MAG: hypothetical protein AAGJ46_13280 [Planctomycetota bacterium]